MKGWLRLHRSILSTPKLQRLPAEQFKACINLWCMADETTGTLPVLEDIAFLLRLHNDATSDLLAALLAANLIARGPGGRFAIHDWQEWQYQSDTSTKRVQKHREKRSTETQRNVSVTPSEAETEQKQNRTEADAAAAATATAATEPEPKNKPNPIPEGFDGQAECWNAVQDLLAIYADGGFAGGDPADARRAAGEVLMASADPVRTVAAWRPALRTWVAFWTAERTAGARPFVTRLAKWLRDGDWARPPKANSAAAPPHKMTIAERLEASRHVTLPGRTSL